MVLTELTKVNKMNTQPKEHEDVREFAESIGMVVIVKHGNKEFKKGNLDEWHEKATPYTITVKLEGRRMSFSYWTGSAITEEPEIGEALDCLLSDASCGESSFADFCADCGYSTDSIRAREIWQACVRTHVKLMKLLGSHYDRATRAERL